MTYRHLPLTCECGQVPARILEVGFTADHELVIHYWCAECRRVVCVSKPLTECWRECPKAETAPVSSAPVAIDPTAADTQFLHSMGITLREKN